MFRQRTSSQKPGDELLANFRQQFPEVAAATSSSVAGPPAITATANQADVTATQQERSQSLHHDSFRDQDPTPRAQNEQWRFTPSLLDPNSFSFASFANQTPGYYTPTPGGTNTIYHPQAGDLHTPTLSLGMGLGTPLSMPTAEGSLHHHASMDIPAFHHPFHPQQQQFHPFNPFVQPPPPQPSFAPSSFVHQDTGYETMDQDGGSPIDSDPLEDKMGSIDGNFQGPSPMMSFQHRQFGVPMASQLPPSATRFRFHTTLNAPTAMIRHAEEIPVTYLNKGQAYSLSVIDTTPSLPIAPGTRLRTFVRVSFEDEQQRQKPGVCWTLWKEGRGSNEAHQRGGKLQAVEYVEAGQPAEGDDKRTRIELDSSSFDGFSVIWTPGTSGTVDCNIAVRFNFLSTDFSHSKGVKGIPVRLCAKTHLMIPDNPRSPPLDNAAEVCYCKVKLFRDHGAERKLSNDIAHIRKSIDKLKQQITQAESGMKDFSKRKRAAAGALAAGAAHSKAQSSQRPGKVQKHKRTWSMSSASSAGGGARVPPEEDLHFKLKTLQDMFTSTRPVSVLYLCGEETDDPDLYPVALSGESLDLTKVESRESNAWRSEHSPSGGLSLVSPSPSSLSLHSQSSVSGSKSRWLELQRGDPAASQSGSDQPTKVRQTDDAGNLTGWIEALGVDSTYRPPPERPAKPVACFYVAQRDSSNRSVRELHRAVYLQQRTLRDFIQRMAAKWNFDINQIVRTVHVLPRGLEVEIDDDTIQQLPEGQDLTFELVEAAGAAASSLKREWEMVIDAPGEIEPMSPHSGGQSAYELRLTF
ncbi:CP2 transcription factor-domain-containing protein [Podospora appendiculata]|uniref:CP2 transcription factor-domain-containing protein n=1 Tax=Podospora appendiculata TaxID=314037 RepID=A0AAE0XCH4_9PEZI|nr:CP2 transcription factor-domain-containing protein [Podospora appendiculata]